MNIIFESEEHEKFFYDCLSKARYTNNEYQALFYCLGITEDCREAINDLYDFKEAAVKPEGLHKGWTTGTDRRVIRLAFDLYNGGVPTAYELDGEEKIEELYNNTICSIFNYGGVGKYLLQAIKIRFEIEE